MVNLYCKFHFLQKHVFNTNRHAPRFCAPNFQQFACFCRNLLVSSTSILILVDHRITVNRRNIKGQRSVIEAYVTQDAIGMH